MAGARRLQRPRSWSVEDDEQLLSIIYQRRNGNKMPCWNDVADLLDGDKTSKSCRLRWENQLKPDINHASFNAEEDQVVINMQRVSGNRWAMIAKVLTDQAEEKRDSMIAAGELLANEPFPYRRTDNQVKNRWHAVLKEGKGKKRRIQESDSDIEADMEMTETLKDKDFTKEDSDMNLGPNTPRDAEPLPSTRIVKRQRMRMRSPSRPLNQLSKAAPLPAIPCHHAATQLPQLEAYKPARVEVAAPGKTRPTATVEELTKFMTQLCPDMVDCGNLPAGELTQRDFPQAMEVEEPFTTKQPERNKNNKSDLSLSSFPELDFQPTNSYMRGGDVLSSRADKKKTFCAPAVGRGANFMASDNISDWAKPSLFAKERFSVLV